MVVLVLLMLVILAAAGAVVVYVAYPHRGEEVPGATRLGEVMKRGLDTVGTLVDRPDENAEDRRVDTPEREHTHR